MSDDDYNLAFMDGLQAAWDSVNAIIKHGELPAAQAELRNGIIMASNEIMKMIKRSKLARKVEQ